MGWMSISRQAFVRLAISIGLLVTLIGIGSYYVYSAAVTKSARERTGDLMNFYQARIQQLERDWELQAQDFKVRIEVSRLLGDRATALAQMQAFMTLQGTSRSFEYLLIEDPEGRPVFSFGDGLTLQVLPATIRAALGPDAEGSTWHRANGGLYRVFLVPIWLGERGNGLMALFFKVDNGLLFSISSPDIALWVSHQGEPVAHSRGHGNLDRLRVPEAATEEQGAGRGELPWGAAADGTRLHIDAPVKALFSRLQLVAAAALIPLVDGLILWGTLGLWLMRSARRVDALRGAVVAYADESRPTETFSTALARAHGPRDDEISVVADALDTMAAQAQRREQERAQEQAQRLLWSQVFASSIDAIVITDRENRILSVNQAFTRLTGYSELEVVGKNPHMLSSGRESAEFYAAMWQDITLKSQWSGEVEDRRKDGTVYPKWLNITVVRNSEGQVVNYVGVFKDITEQKQNEERVLYLANHDTLTGLPNRHLLLDRLHQAIELAGRNAQMVALLFLDLDNFKWVNDSLGHASGDRLLVTVAERLAAAVRGSDTVARLGGDEFVLLLLQPSGNKEISMIAEKVIDTVSQPMALGGHDFHVTTSIGIGVYPNDGHDPATLLKHADTAMYAAKAQGKNQYRFFDAEMNRLAMERIDLERDLRQACKRGEFELHYQAQYCLRCQTIGSAEALLRWRHPQRGLLAPDRFIALAEETAQIIEIGEWVLSEACRQLAAWQAAGLGLRGVAVNLSAIQLESDTFVDSVEQILEASGVAPEAIEFELTESAVLRHPERSITTLNRLRQLGIRLALDDFGTGYSSLSYLKRLPVDSLKIDRSFIQGVPDDADDAQIVRMIVALGKSVHLDVVAEGIETEAHRQFLEELGCDFLQGYLIAKPLPADDFARLAAGAGAGCATCPRGTMGRRCS